MNNVDYPVIVDSLGSVPDENPNVRKIATASMYGKMGSQVSSIADAYQLPLLNRKQRRELEKRARKSKPSKRIIFS